MKSLKPFGKEYRGLGLTWYCPSCNTNVSSCRKNGKFLGDCPHRDKLRVKQYVGTADGKRVSKTYKEKDIKQILPLAIKFKEEVQTGKAQELLPQVENSAEEIRPAARLSELQLSEITNDNLLTLQAKYLTFISGDESVPLHLRKSRSTPYVSDIEHCFRILIDCLKKERYDSIQYLKVSDIGKVEVGNFFEYLKKEKGYSNRSVNKNISFMRTFYHWLARYEGLQTPNPFLYIVKQAEYHNPLAITKEEFDATLKKTIKENGIVKGNGVKGFRNMYRYWLKDAFKLSLFTGRRREEIINFRFNDIIKDEFDNPILIASEDRKVNNIQHRTEEHQKKINYIPITAELLELLLNELSYEKFKDTDTFILAPELKTKRSKSMSNVISRGFSHFFKLTNPNRELKFRSVRKAYLSQLQVFSGDAKAISGHSGNAILKEHYWDKAVLAKSLRNFSVFGNKEQTRISELSALRKNHQQQKISLEK